MKQKNKKIFAVDLFCGAGGLTYGLERSGISVKLGVDIDPACHYPIEANTKSKFVCEDIACIDTSIIERAFEGGAYSVIAGCAPCQPFSTYSRSAKKKLNGTEDWKLVGHFGEIINDIKPDVITMENVPPLVSQPIFKQFVKSLRGYSVDWKIVECESIGLPQTRKRLVLVASKLGDIQIPDFNYRKKTVRAVLKNLSKLNAGEQDPKDNLHKACRLSKINLERIRSSKPGGTWRDWPKHLRAKCHQKESGATYPSVYGRMEWDSPSPTITTQCFGYGNGRFGHPEEDRAITLREAAMLQGFPKTYSFLSKEESVSFSKIGRLIGNAVPVTLGKVIGKLICDHISEQTA
ncbi:DNA cytosine methyltransferase [Marinibactrum halimedae]|uniref:Cytosine-specific methyltransferase n=1 Tax=Marinibactrum halimedae TaxID=1444977 RepID=A0AA37WRC3_9GAMM|nr:DNA cytosine methyltransferase [Marinibactrum halimedae]MCD9460025.1 DNA cytosine methyltransferase [Marinibactrum halimedae]GLS28207.1 restriction endonuclease subunit M [Marinibactrum halimedae]